LAADGVVSLTGAVSVRIPEDEWALSSVSVGDYRRFGDTLYRAAEVRSTPENMSFFLISNIARRLASRAWNSIGVRMLK